MHQTDKVDRSVFNELFELESNTDLYGDLTDAEICAEVPENDEEDEFIEEIDPKIPKVVKFCKCFFQSLRLFCINEQLSHEYLDTFDLLESEIELKSTRRKQMEITDYFK